MSAAPLFSTPVLVIDTETTGIPGKTEERLLHVVELGAVCMDVWGEEVASFRRLVRLPPNFDVAAVAEALAVSGITPELLAERGCAPGFASAAFECFRASLPGLRWTAFNLRFDSWFLERDPWFLSPRRQAGCIMEFCQAAMVPYCDKAAGTGPLKWLEPRERYAGEQGQWKWPKSSEAAEWLRGRGHPIPQLRHHRALDDARMEAAILVALLREKKGLAAPVDGHGGAP